jgi:hypothetical protein
VRNDGKPARFRNGDDESIARVVVEGRKLGGRDADVQFKREDNQAMMLDNSDKPLLRRMGQFQFSPGHFDGDFETADG